ncbi:MAG TPA: hypothetical protein VNA25_22690 [Phycisphaerae bacterium]|nr:hypothetical protein [Phycisphaerae bacterium]
MSEKMAAGATAHPGTGQPKGTGEMSTLGGPSPEALEIGSKSPTCGSREARRHSAAEYREMADKVSCVRLEETANGCRVFATDKVVAMLHKAAELRELVDDWNEWAARARPVLASLLEKKP